MCHITLCSGARPSDGAGTTALRGGLPGAKERAAMTVTVDTGHRSIGQLFHSSNSSWIDVLLA